MFKAEYIPYILRFKKPAGTSRGVLPEKESWFFRLHDSEYPGQSGIGECSLIPGLSPDDRSAIPLLLDELCDLFSSLSHEELLKVLKDESGAPAEIMETARDKCADFPAVYFGLETALKDYEQGGKQMLFPSDFTRGSRGIPINGLIWMGSKTEMFEQVSAKLEEGFSVLKLKVGAIAFEEELSILKHLRASFSKSDLEIRLDANGAWDPGVAMEKLQKLAPYEIHSLEQPIPAGHWEEMAGICSASPIPVALDEELIDVRVPRQELLHAIQASYIILKPSLLGGFAASQEWIDAAESLGIGWWITSALESNIGLNAIAQWTASLDIKKPQGLGTGALFTNNIPSPLEIIEDELFHLKNTSWDFSIIES